MLSYLLMPAGHAHSPPMTPPGTLPGYASRPEHAPAYCRNAGRMWPLWAAAETFSSSPRPSVSSAFLHFVLAATPTVGGASSRCCGLCSDSKTLSHAVVSTLPSLQCSQLAVAAAANTPTTSHDYRQSGQCSLWTLQDTGRGELLEAGPITAISLLIKSLQC